MVKDVREGVRGCAHCKAANIASHNASQLLKSIKLEVPFDVMVFDIWKPGVIPSKGRKGTPPCQVVLTGVDLMTTFAGCGEMFVVDSAEAASTVTVADRCPLTEATLIQILEDYLTAGGEGL